MLGLGLSIADLARRRGDAAPPTGIDALVIEGDSITYLAGDSARYGSLFAAHRPNKTVAVNADNSRTVGGPAWPGPPVEGADSGTAGAITSAAMNTLLAQRPADIASGAQLITAMIGTNDLQTFSVANYRARLAAWAGPIRSAGIKVGYSPPLSLRSDKAYGAPAYDAFQAKLATLMTDGRDPAVWGQFADFYIPMGEHPDLNAADNTAYISGDGVHPNNAGHAKLYEAFRPALDTLLDVTRANSTTMLNAVWPGSETNLDPAGTITRRFIVEGIAHGGIALTGGNALGVTGAAGNPQLRRANGAWGASFTGWLYNGDVIEFRVTLAATNNTARSIDLTVGSETRTLSFTTVAQVTPATYTNFGVVNSAPQDSTHTYAAKSFPVTGTAVIAVHAQGAPTSVTVGGVAATRRRAMSSDSSLSVWTVPIGTAGNKDIVVGFGVFRGQSTVSWGVVENADAVPVQVDPASDGSPGHDSQPFITGTLTVPASGIAIAFFGEYGGGTSVTPATANAGTTLVAEGQGSFQGEVMGIAVGTRSTSGTASFNFGFGAWSRVALVFKAAGT